MFLIRFQAFRGSLRGELPHVQIFMNDGPNPLAWDAQVLIYWFSRNPAVFQDQLVNMINNPRVVTVLGRSGRGASQVEKSPRLNWATQFLIVAYDGACSPNISFRMTWISFGALPWRKKKNEMTFHDSMFWNRARRLTCFLSASVTRKDLHFGTWTDPSFQRRYRFRPTIWGSKNG